MSRQAQFPKERGIDSKLTGYLGRFILRSQTCGPSRIFSLLPDEKKEKEIPFWVQREKVIPDGKKERQGSGRQGKPRNEN